MGYMPLVCALTSVAALGCAAPALAQAPRAQPAGGIRYESVAPGAQAAEIFRTDALRDVTVEVKDFIVGPGKAIADLPVQGFGVTELKSGEVETTIDGQTTRRRPGEFWVVRPGQRYGLRSLGGLVVLHVVIFTRR